jgi:hypothetical protein
MADATTTQVSSPAQDYAVPPQFRNLVSFDRQAQDALDFLRQKDLDRIALAKSQVEDQALANFIDAAKSPTTGKFDPLAPAALPAALRLAATRHAPILDAFVGMQSSADKHQLAQLSALEATKPFVAGENVYQLGPGGQYGPIGEAPINENVALSMITSGDPVKAQRGQAWLDAAKKNNPQLANKDTMEMSRLRGGLVESLNILNSPQSKDIKDIFDKAIKSGQSSPDEIATLDPMTIIAKFLGNDTSKMAQAQLIRQYANAATNASKYKFMIQDNGGRVDDIEARFGKIPSQFDTTPSPPVQGGGTAADMTAAKAGAPTTTATQRFVPKKLPDFKEGGVGFDEIKDSLANHESGGGKNKVPDKANANGTRDWGLYQINDVNITGTGVGGDFQKERDRIFKEHGIGDSLEARQNALVKNDDLNEEIAKLIYKYQGLKPWSTSEKVVKDYNAIKSQQMNAPTVAPQAPTSTAPATAAPAKPQKKLVKLGTNPDGSERWGWQ